MRRGRAHVGAGFERAWSAGAELGVLYGITFGGARKAKIFSGARAEAALATRFLGEVRGKKRLTFRVLFRCLVASLLRVPREGRCGLPSLLFKHGRCGDGQAGAVSVEDVCW